MSDEVRWERVECDSRIDVLVDDLHEFVDAVLGSIDYDDARKDPRRWAVVCGYFAGCAEAARLQTAAGGADRVVSYFAVAFPRGRDAAAYRDRSGEDEGFADFMDWLSDPVGFRPSRLSAVLQVGE